ncbi:MAG: nucleotidyltransferase family protein [Terracidiphilus sp.]
MLPALQLRDADTTQLIELSDAQWESLLEFCDIAHLTLPMAQLPSTGLPQWVVDRLKINLADNALRFERVKSTYREAAAALEQAGVEHIVIKGFTQAPDYGSDARLRRQADLDIFCLPEKIDAAQRALQAIGYEALGEEVSYAAADHGPSLVRTGNWKWRGNPFDPDMPIDIELHFCFWNERVSHIGDPGTKLFWERRTVREVAGFRFCCLSPTDHLAHLTLHIVRNLFLGDWIIHHVRELAFFLHSHANDEIFWQKWSKTHSESCGPLAAIAFYHARAWFGCLLHPLAAQEIDRLPASRRSWLQRFSGSALEVMFEQNKDALWLQLGFLSSRKEQWGILKKALIPSRIGPIRSPGVQVRNKRLVHSDGRPLWQQYAAYLISRSSAHGRAGFATLWRGFRWRCSQPLELTRGNGRHAGYG